MAEKLVLTNSGLFAFWDDAADLALDLVPGRRGIVSTVKVLLFLRSGVKVLQMAQEGKGIGRKKVLLEAAKTGILYILIDHDAEIEKWLAESMQSNDSATIVVQSRLHFLDP